LLLVFFFFLFFLIDDNQTILYTVSTSSKTLMNLALLSSFDF